MVKSETHRDPCLKIQDRDKTCKTSRPKNLHYKRDFKTLPKDSRDFEIAEKVYETQGFRATIRHPLEWNDQLYEILFLNLRIFHMKITYYPC